MTPELKPLPPKDAIAYFRQKGLEGSFAWQDVWQEEHAKAFTVAKMMQRDLLADTRQALDAALSDGTTFEQFKAELAPKLKAKGWWGKQLMGDPLTGEVKVAQLGSHRRLKTIFDVNMRTSYQAGNWARIQRTKKTFPYLLYTIVNDNRVRPEHRAWSGVCLPVDHPWWDTHYPPCGWRCRCGTISLTEKMMKARGLKVEEPARFAPTVYENPRTGEVTTVERGIDPGFNFNVGKAPMRGLTPRPAPTPPGQAAASARRSEEAAKSFLKPFSADAKPKVIKDRDGWPLPVGPDMFKDAKGYYTVPRSDLIVDLPHVAEALKTYDTAEWVWAHKLGDEAAISRQMFKVVDDSYGKVNSRAVYLPAPSPLVALAKDNGIDLRGFNHTMTSEGVRHVRRQHGNPETEAARNQVAVEYLDLASRLRRILATPDSVEFGLKDKRGAQAVRFTARINDIEYVVVENILPGLKALELKTLYKRKISDKGPAGIDASRPNRNALDGSGFSGNVIDLRSQRKVWQSFTQVQLVRRYTKTLDNRTITIDFSPESWTFDIQPKP